MLEKSKVSRPPRSECCKAVLSLSSRSTRSRSMSTRCSQSTALEPKVRIAIAITSPGRGQVGPSYENGALCVGTVRRRRDVSSVTERPRGKHLDSTSGGADPRRAGPRGTPALGHQRAPTPHLGVRSHVGAPRPTATQPRRLLANHLRSGQLLIRFGQPDAAFRGGVWLSALR